jgi:electron transfer flavoprotein alpha subunit
VKFLVFLEHHGGELEKGGLGALGKAASLGEAEGVVLGPGAAEVAAQAGVFGAAKVYACEDDALAAPLPQPRVDALATLVEKSGTDAVLFGASVLSADVAAGLSARLDAGLNWDLTDLVLEGEQLVGKRPALGDTVLVDVGWTGGPRLALVRSGALDPVESGGSAEVETFEATYSAVVILSLPPSAASSSTCTEPLPNERRPMMTARSSCLSAPARISAADAVFSEISTATGRRVSTPPLVAFLMSCLSALATELLASTSRASHFVVERADVSAPSLAFAGSRVAFRATAKDNTVTIEANVDGRLVATGSVVMRAADTKDIAAE